MPWKPGQSGNPQGRQRSVQSLTRIARKHCRKALELCVAALRNEELEWKVRLIAAGMLLDRGLGKPAQQVSVAQLTDEELMTELVTRRAQRAKEEAANAEKRRDSNGHLDE